MLMLRGRQVARRSHTPPQMHSFMHSDRLCVDVCKLTWQELEIERRNEFCSVDLFVGYIPSLFSVLEPTNALKSQESRIFK